MHGRLKVRTSEEQAEAKKREQQAKLKVYSSVTSQIFSKREKGEYDEEGLLLTQRVLEKNSDFYTMWNYRREILQALIKEKSTEDIKKMALVELDLTQSCLRMNPKSYAIWQHRIWTMDFNPEADWKRELKLCSSFLSLDERNFHCWDYRRLASRKCQISAKEELEYSTSLIETNFSNYSAWHYRSTLLPTVHTDKDTGKLKEDVLLKEFEIVQNAAFTDPDDQSVWFYHRWLLGRNTISPQIITLGVLKSQNIVGVLLSEPLKSDSVGLTLTIGTTDVDTEWKPVPLDAIMSSVWVCNLPNDANFNSKDCTLRVSLKGTEKTCELNCCVNGNQNLLLKSRSKAALFRSDFSAAAKDVLERELESCEQLNDLEPNCKWTLFTSVLLMRALNDAKFQDRIYQYINQLMDVDSARKYYYKDLGSKFTIEDTIHELAMDATELCLSNRNLTSLYHFDHFFLIEKVDLSSNNLSSVCPLHYLICVKTIILDDNKINSLEGLEMLQSLKHLSVKRNHIQATSTLTPLKTCSKLQHLFLKGNPVENECDFMKMMKEIPSLKFVDEINICDDSAKS